VGEMTRLFCLAAASAIFLGVSGANLDRLPEALVERLGQEIEELLLSTLSSDGYADPAKLSVDPFDNFALPADGGQQPEVVRSVRSTCGGSGVGNLGFNSFNFLTFMVLTFNAIANTNNNINNNNNNDNDINLNSISQDSNNAVSNSDNSNTVMVMILPMPGKRSAEKFSGNHFCPITNSTINVQQLIAAGNILSFFVFF
jgi:hypothetical protein